MNQAIFIIIALGILAVPTVVVIGLVALAWVDCCDYYERGLTK